MGWSLVAVLVPATALACSADEVREAVIGELAIGAWACAPDDPEAGYTPFTVRVDEGGTFDVESEPEPGTDARFEIAGTWEVVDGDLRWGFEGGRTPESVVEDFDDLTLESTEFTLLWAGIFEANDGTDDPDDEQDILVEAASADSVTMRVPGGEPWTCDRR